MTRHPAKNPRLDQRGDNPETELIGMNLSRTRILVPAAWLALAGCILSALYILSPEKMTPADLRSYDASIEKGRYIATISNCASCHTAGDDKAYAGGLEFQTPFGALYSTNITMDRETGIGGWSFEDFYQSMKQGIRPDGSHLYPAFPYTAFAKMSDEDIASLFLFMQTIEPVYSPARSNHLEFPYKLRELLPFWKALFHDTATYEADAAKSALWNRGAYLVEGPAHCGACHTPRNILGAERKDLALTGGVYLDRVRTGQFREWSAVNLTPAPTGLAVWSKDEISAYLKTGQTRHAVVHGPMNEVIMNSTRFMTDADVLAIATYLKDIPPNEESDVGEPSSEQLAAGEIVYTVHCGSCHLPTGAGDNILGVSLIGSAIVQAPNPSSLINVILYGPHLPEPPFVADRTRMKMLGKRLSDDDIASVATYIRSSFGNHASAVSPAQVKRQR